MRYIRIESDSMVDGDGIRVVLWCQGCSLLCKGCHNPHTWNFEDGSEWNENSEKELFNKLNHSYIKGITFSGGHPLEKENIFEVYKIASRD